MIDLNNVQSINLNQFFDSVKFRSGSGYHLSIDFCIVMFHMLMILMKLSFVPQTFFRIFTFSSHTEYVKRKGIVIAWVKKKKFSSFDKFLWFSFGGSGIRTHDTAHTSPTLRDNSYSRNQKNYASGVTFNYFYSDSRKLLRIKADVLTP